jgi:hypothetical protein
MNQFIEFSFCLPFYDLFNRHWFSGTEKMVDDDVDFKALADYFHIKLDKDLLTKNFEKTTKDKGDIFVLMNPDDRFQFIYLDFFNDPTDQAAMIQLAVRCRNEHEMKVYKLLQPLMHKGAPRSALAIDWYNNQLGSYISDPTFHLKGRTVHFL